MIILETSRLLLRHQVLTDLDDLWSLYCDPEITKHIPDAPRTREEAKDELEWHMNGHRTHPELGLWATIYKESGRFIGRCGLLPWEIDGNHEVEVAYAISRDFWRQGLATEAANAIIRHGFTNLKQQRLICLIEKENIASKKVAEKIGMKFEKVGYDEAGPFLVYALNKADHI